MNIETFQSVCERQAIKLFISEGDKWKNNEILKNAEALAEKIALKHEDFAFFFEIALTAINSVFKNPDRYTRLLKAAVDPVKLKKQIDALVA